MLPTSSIVTVRLSGAAVSMYFKILEKSLIPLAARVLIGPEEIAFARMPLGPRLLAR